MLLAIQMNIGEIIFFGLIALIVGIVAHYLWSLRSAAAEEEKESKTGEPTEAYQWRLKFYELTEQRQQELDDLRQEITKAREQEEQLQIELEELQLLNQQLVQRQKQTPAAAPAAPQEVNASEYLQQLKVAQDYLQEHNQTIARLLQQTESLEQMQQKIHSAEALNESLMLEVQTLQQKLQHKDEEVALIRHRSEVALSMKQELETTYAEVHALQQKLMRVEQQLSHQPAGQVFKYEELEEANLVLTGEMAMARVRQQELSEENAKLKGDLLTAQDRLRESEMQRQHLAKRIEYLESLNSDLQQVADYNKKMEAQIKRLGEMEHLLSKMSGTTEQDQ